MVNSGQSARTPAGVSKLYESMPAEIERWVARCNNGTRRILRIIDTKGNNVWEEL
jgi:hypothetical protein